MGKVVTIFYAIIGIPLMLLCLSNIGDVMATSFRFLYWRVCCYVCTRKPKKKKHRNRQPQRAASRSVRARTTSTRRRGAPVTRQPSPTYYSDTECREAGDRVAMKRSRDPGRRSDASTAPPGYRSRSHPGRSSDGPGRGVSQPPQRYSSPPRDYRRTRSYQRDSRSPVLFNRYARDYEDDELQDKAAASLRLDNIYDIFNGLDASDYDTNYNNKWGNPRSKSLPRQHRDKYMVEEEGRRYLSEKGVHKDRGYESSNYRRNQRSSYDHSNKYLDVDNGSEESFNEDEFSKYCRDLDADYKLRNSNKYNANYDSRYRYDRSPNRRPVRRKDSREDDIEHYRGSRSPERRKDKYSEDGGYRGQSRGRRDRYNSDKDEDDDDYDLERPSHSKFSKGDKYQGPSARIMSPMGLHVSRQSRLVDNFDIEYINDDGQSSIKSQIKPVPIWLCVFLVISYIIAGAFLFHNWEHWSLLDSAYFCFITLTTIGFGDFVPAQGVKSNSEISIALCSLYLLFGISLLAMSFNLVQEEVIANVRSVAKRLGIIKPDVGESDED